MEPCLVEQFSRYLKGQVEGYGVDGPAIEALARLPARVIKAGLVELGLGGVLRRCGRQEVERMVRDHGPALQAAANAFDAVTETAW